MVPWGDGVVPAGDRRQSSPALYPARYSLLSRFPLRVPPVLPVPLAGRQRSSNGTQVSACPSDLPSNTCACHDGAVEARTEHEPRTQQPALSPAALAYFTASLAMPARPRSYTPSMAPTASTSLIP